MFTLRIINAEYQQDFDERGYKQDETFKQLDEAQAIIHTDTYTSIQDVVDKSIELAEKYQVEHDRITVHQLISF